MIKYDEGYWAVNPRLLIQIHGSVIPRALLWTVPASILSVALFYTWGGYDEEQSGGFIEAWSGYSFVLGFLLVNRMNIAYSRYWEAASLTNIMRGEWMDTYYSVCAFCTQAPEKAEEVLKFKTKMTRLFSMLHQAATSVLTDTALESVPVIDPGDMEKSFLEFVSGDHPHRTEILVSWIEQSVLLAAKDKLITVEPPILSRLFHEFSKGVVMYTEVMKIRFYKLPFPTVQMMQWLMLFHTLFTPLVASLIMYNWRWTAMLSFSAIFSFWCINFIAIDIEQPFEPDSPNALPMKEIQEQFNKRLLGSLSPELAKAPRFDTAVATRFSQTEVKATGSISMRTLSARITESKALRQTMR